MQPWRMEDRSGVRVLTWPALAEAGVDAVVTTRDGGVSTGPYASLNLGLHVGDDPAAVVENRRRAAAAMGLELGDLVFCTQIHGRRVVTVTAADRGRGATSESDVVAAADALVTRDAGVGLVAMVADCVPLVLADPVTRTLAVVHAGWRGTVAGVTTATVEALSAAGARPGDIVAAIGPAIAPATYEVGDDVAQAAQDAFGAATAEVLDRRDDGSHRFDLWAANRRQLLDAGVAADRIALADLPTGAGGPFFSDRAERPCGRFAVLARLRPA
jgi:polyphenol oxidase